MLTSVQPHRTQVRSQTIRQNPLHQQQVRQSSSNPKPQSQIDAMPSNSTYTLPQFTPRIPLYNPATCHPVFFTQTLRKPPFPFSDSGGGMVNPVAFGYVAESLNGRKGDSGAKL